MTEAVAPASTTCLTKCHSFLLSDKMLQRVAGGEKWQCNVGRGSHFHSHILCGHCGPTSIRNLRMLEFNRESKERLDTELENV
jgi:hypothetical protein